MVMSNVPIQALQLPYFPSRKFSESAFSLGSNMDMDTNPSVNSGNLATRAPFFMSTAYLYITDLLKSGPNGSLRCVAGG